MISRALSSRYRDKSSTPGVPGICLSRTSLAPSDSAPVVAPNTSAQPPQTSTFSFTASYRACAAWSGFANSAIQREPAPWKIAIGEQDDDSFHAYTSGVGRAFGRPIRTGARRLFIP